MRAPIKIGFEIREHFPLDGSPDFRIHVVTDEPLRRVDSTGGRLAEPDPEGVVPRANAMSIYEKRGWRTPEGAAAALQRAIQEALIR